MIKVEERPRNIMNAPDETRARCIQAVNQHQPLPEGQCYFLCIDGTYRLYHRDDKIEQDEFDAITESYFVPHDTCLLTGQRLDLKSQGCCQIVTNSIQGLLALLYCGLCVRDSNLPQISRRSYNGRSNGDTVSCDIYATKCSHPSCSKQVTDNNLFALCSEHTIELSEGYCDFLDIEMNTDRSDKDRGKKNVMKLLNVLFGTDLVLIITRLISTQNMRIIRDFCGSCELAGAQCSSENLSGMCGICGGRCSVFEYIPDPARTYSVSTKSFNFSQIALSELQQQLKVHIEGTVATIPTISTSSHISRPP